MRKIILLSSFLLISAFAIGQSVTITPSQTTNQSNTSGENINVTANSNSMGIYGRRFNGTFAAKSPILSGNELFRVSAGGWYTGSNADESQHAAIKFNATENWNFSGSGTKITFTTTPNLGTSQVERMVINHNGKVGIGNSAPLGKLHINHLATPTDAHLHLQSTGSSSAVIKATSTNTGEWENHFLTNAAAASNVVYWTNSINSTTPLILTGEGDALVERNATVGGFTKLGSDAPQIKMKKLTGTTAVTQGGAVSIPHGVTDLKILSLRVMVNYSGNATVPDGFNKDNGYECNAFVDGVGNIRVENKSANSVSILSKPFTILIAYEN